MTRRSLMLLAAAAWLALPALRGWAAGPQAGPPAWFLKPPSDDLSLYGSGEGATLEDAKLAALNQIASQLSITVGSTLSKTETVEQQGGRESHSKRIDQDIRSQVERIKLNNYEIEKSEAAGGKVYVLVSVDKDTLAQEEKAQIGEALGFAEDLYEKGRQRSTIERMRDLRSIAERLSAVKPLAYLLISLEDGYDPSPFLAAQRDYASKLEDAARSLKVHLDTAGDASVLSDVLAEALSREAIKVAPAPCGQDPDCVTVSVTAAIRRLGGPEAKMVKLAAGFTVLDVEGKALARNNVETSGASYLDHDQALRAACRALGEKAKSQGIFRILGMQ